MRIQGTLLKWDDERGFGYIRTRESRVVLPVHRSEFPHGQRRPQIGDPLSFDIRTGADGRKEACAEETCRGSQGQEAGRAQTRAEACRACEVRREAGVNPVRTVSATVRASGDVGYWPWRRRWEYGSRLTARCTCCA